MAGSKPGVWLQPAAGTHVQVTTHRTSTITVHNLIIDNLYTTMWQQATGPSSST